MTMLTAREGYRLWAPVYEAETPVSFLEQRIVGNLAVATQGCALLDVGCGTGRRLRDSDARLAVGVDLSTHMLSHADAGLPRAAADVHALPFADDVFDVVWCRLVVGHVAELDGAYHELARVCRPGGAVIVSDFCTEAWAAGHRRGFRDAGGVRRELEHFNRTHEEQFDVARTAGLMSEAFTCGEVGPSVRSFYEAAGRLAAYEEQVGLRLVHAIAFRKAAG